MMSHLVGGSQAVCEDMLLVTSKELFKSRGLWEARRAPHVGTESSREAASPSGHPQDSSLGLKRLAQQAFAKGPRCKRPLEISRNP